jgi:tetratricopeptide (TPR) repeat protein
MTTFFPATVGRLALILAAAGLVAACASPAPVEEAAEPPPIGRSIEAEQARDLALAARQLGDTAALGTALQRWRELAPRDEQAWSVTLQYALETEQPALVDQAVSAWLGLRQSSHDRWEDLAIAAREHWGESVLVDAVAEALSQLPLRASVLDNLYRSELAEALGLDDQAMRAAQRAVDLLQEDSVPGARQVRTLRWHARLMRDAGNALAEIASLRRALVVDPGATEVRLQMAQRLAEAGVVNEALDLLVESDDEDTRVALMLGFMAAQQNNSELLAQALARLSADESEQGILHHAQLLAELGEREKALSTLERLTDGAMGQRASLERARLLAVLGRPDEARAALESVLTADSDEIAARAWLMQAQLDGAPDSEQAFDVLTRALAAVPGNAELLYARSLAAEQQGYLDTAERDLRQVIEMQPDDAHAYNALGYMLTLHTERLQEAETLIQRALSLSPNDQAIIDSLGWLRFRQGRSSEALPLLQRAHGMGFNPEIAAHLVEVLAATGQLADAQQLLQQALQQAPDHDGLQRLSEELL